MTNKTEIDHLSKVTVNPAAIAWYTSFVAKNWPTKWAGEKPSEAMFMVPGLLGKRPGVEGLHIAMCLRPEGCTVQQFQTAGSCGPANNYRRSLVKTGLLSVVPEGKPYAYKAKLTAKGWQRCERALKGLVDAAANTKAAVAKPDKANRKAKVLAAKKAANKAKGDAFTFYTEGLLPMPATMPHNGAAAVTDEANAAPATDEAASAENAPA